MKKRDIAIETAKKFLGLPYKWGGSNPLEGFDCSGLIVEILKTTGIIGSESDMTAHILSEKYPETDILKVGSLVYWDWNEDGRIDHVEMIVAIEDSGEMFTIGASGGDSTSVSEERSIRQDAFVKIRPLREGYKMANDPF